MCLFHLRVNNKERSYCFCSKILSFFFFLLSCHWPVSLDLPNIMIIFIMSCHWSTNIRNKRVLSDCDGVNKFGD